MKNETANTPVERLAQELEKYPRERRLKFIDELLVEIRSKMPEGAIDQSDAQQMHLYLIYLQLHNLKTRTKK